MSPLYNSMEKRKKYSTQLQAMNVTVNTLTLEEGKKCSQLDIETRVLLPN